VKYETNCAERGVRVMQALMFVMIIAQTMCTKITAVAGKGRFEMATREQAKSAEKEASNCAAATSVQKEKTENREQTEANFAAAMGVQTKQTENTGQTKAVKVEVATSVQKEQTESREQTDVANVAAATTNMGQAEQTQQVRQARLEQAANVAEKWKTAANENEMGRAHANGTGRNAASREPAVMKRSTRSGWPSVTAAAFTTIVLIIMMSTTAGATEHGLTQRMMRVRQEMEWDWERDRTQMKPIWQTASDKVDKIDTIMRTVDLFEMEVQKWQEMESGRVRRIKDKDNIDFVTKVGELQQTMNRLGELKRGDCRVHRTDAGEARHIRDDKAEATLQILDELNNDMRSKIKKQGITVNLRRHIQFMSRLLDEERHKAQNDKELRQGKPAETGSTQEQKARDMSEAEERAVGQLSRRHTMFKRRLQDDGRQREGTEKERRHTLSQVNGFMQEQLENDVKVYNRSDKQNEKSDTNDEKVLKNIPNAQNYVARQTAKQQAAHSAQETVEQASSRSRSESVSDSSRVRSAVLPDSGETMPYELDPADTRGGQQGVASSEQACLRLELRVEKVCAYWWTVGTYWMQYEHDPADKRGSQEGIASSEQACLRLELRVEKVCAYWWTVGTYWMQCAIVVVAIYSILISLDMIEERRYKRECHALGLKYPGPDKMDVKSYIANGIALSWIMTVCVLLVMSPARNQIAEVGSNIPVSSIEFDMPLGARAKIISVIKTKDTTSSDNSQIHTDNGNSGEIKLDTKQQMSDSNIDLDGINQIQMGELEKMAHSKILGGGTKTTKCTQCGKNRKTELVESKARAAAATSTAGQTPLTVEKMKDAVVKTLMTRGPTEAAFAGMHETGRGNELGLEEHTSFGAMTEGATEDEASSDGECTDLGPDARVRRKPANEKSTGGVDTGEVSDIRPRWPPFRLVEHMAFGAMAEGQTADDENSGTEESRPHHAEKFTWNLSVVGMVISALSLIVSIWSYLSNYAGEASGEVVANVRSWTGHLIAFLAAALGVTYLMPLAFIITGTQPHAAAYSVAGIA